MGLWRYLRGTDLLEDSSNNGRDEARALPMPDNQIPWRGFYLTSPNITPSTASAIADVWAAVRVLADAASSLPIHAYRRTQQGRERVTSGRLVELLDRPGPGTTQADLVSMLMAHLLLHGAAYLGKYREQGEVAQLGLLHPEQVWPELENGQLRFRYDPGSSPQQMLTEADVTYIKGLSVDGVHGLSAVSQASRVLGLSDELVKHALSYFQVSDSGGVPRPAGLLKVAPGMGEMGRQRELEGLRAESRPHGILVVEGDASYEDIAANLDDSQFVEQRRLVSQEVARVFRIPPHMLGAPSGDSLTYSTVEQHSLDFVRYSLQPWLRRIELAITHDRDLCFERQYVRFEVDSLLRADAATRADVYTKALDPITGWMSRDEVRRLEDLEPEPTPPPTQLIPMPTQGVANGRPRTPSA
jgi:HK97 family phage portal protein